MPIKKPAPDAIKKRDHAQSVPACSPRSKVILGLDNQHGIYRNPFNVQRHLTSARTHQAFRASAMQIGREVAAAA